MTGVACAVLAAGASRRLGRPKQLVAVGGVPLVRRAVEAACASRCDRVAVVVGAYAGLVAPAVSGAAASVIVNAAWEEGIASSIRAAAAWAEGARCDALVLAACDQPRLSAAHLDALIAAWGAGAELAASAYAGVVGVPAVFDRGWFAGLRVLEGDRGAGALLREAPGVAAVAWPDGALDVDAEDDLATVSDCAAADVPPTTSSGRCRRGGTGASSARRR